MVDFFSCRTGGWAGMLLHQVAQRTASPPSLTTDAPPIIIIITSIILIIIIVIVIIYEQISCMYAGAYVLYLVDTCLFYRRD